MTDTTNTTGLKQLGGIDQNKLSGEFYMTSLLAEAKRCGLVEESRLQKLEVDSVVLLRSTSQQFTKGRSSSVTTERAQALMASNLYTIGVYLKTLPTPEDALAALIQEKFPELYSKGRKRLDTKLRTARLYHANVVRSMVVTRNEAYNDTLVAGMEGFFKLYNPDFGAHEIHITADYPLANPISDLAGIEFIQRYLEAVKLENDFCALFPHHAIHGISRSYHPNYRVLIFNLFQQVFTCALGCVLTGRQARRLSLTPDDVAELSRVLRDLPRAELETTMNLAAEKLIRELDITSSLMQKYMEDALPELCANIAHGLDNETPERVFLLQK
ncbi:MAG: DUF6179 domain-containing protein [Angelakisella sp.]